MENIKFKKFFNFKNNITICNLFISTTPALYIIGVAFLEFTIIYSSLIAIYSILKKQIKVQFNYCFFFNQFFLYYCKSFFFYESGFKLNI